MSTAHQPGGGALDLAALAVRVPEAPDVPTLAEMRDARPLLRKLFEHQLELTRSLRQVADSQSATAAAVLAFDSKLERAIAMAKTTAEETAMRTAQESVPELVEEAERARAIVARDARAKRMRSVRDFIATHAGAKVVEHMVHIAIAFGAIEAMRLLHH